ncbi:SRPBCC domain-containing protein [Devosia oryziradicis]|uniref:SRPBCC domain-containing protein n=1 Tax=Devosia oryziradicis TaxID=2801335 RepID=A0ABX7C030_9HYPH|nr:SRPBCC domain-containing protein [Devosia oryziradicis]QQR36624.1 SRPBCC domain-containing protein [Devosia oryziradicis]
MSRTDTAFRNIRATPSALYQALVTARALEQWLPPSGMTGEMVEFDPRPGGRYRMILRYDDAAIAGKSGSNEDIAEARFIELVPDQRIVQEVDFVSDDPAFQGTMRMSTLLTSLGDETEVRFVAENVPEGISAADHAEGMNSSLVNLAKFVGGTL